MTSEQAGSLTPQAPASGLRERLRGGGASVLLGLAMGVGNALSYGFVLVLTRSLGKQSFGAYAALSTIGIVLAIPAGAFQVIIGRRWADDDHRTTGLWAAGMTGLALTVLTIVASPLLNNVLHLHSSMPAIAMSLMLIPMTVTGAFQGVLLGSGRLIALSALYIVTAGTRLVGAIFCAIAHLSVTQVFLTMAVASLCAAAFGLLVARHELPRAPSHSASLIKEMVRSNSTLAAFTALTNVDVILIRHFCSAGTSGAYGLASTFGRAMCWGTQFVALLVIPRIAASSHGGTRQILWRAAALIAGLGALCCLVISLRADWFVTLVGGSSFSGDGSLVIACLALGTVWALAQLWLFSEMAGNTGFLGNVAWAAVAIEAVGGWLFLHTSPWAIITLAGCCSAAVVAVGIWRTARAPRGEANAPA